MTSTTELRKALDALLQWHVYWMEEHPQGTLHDRDEWVLRALDQPIYPNGLTLRAALAGVGVPQEADPPAAPANDLSTNVKLVDAAALMEVQELLADLVGEVGREKIDGTKRVHMGAWVRARKYLDDIHEWPIGAPTPTYTEAAEEREGAPVERGVSQTTRLSSAPSLDPERALED